MSKYKFVLSDSTTFVVSLTEALQKAHNACPNAKELKVEHLSHGTYLIAGIDRKVRIMPVSVSTHLTFTDIESGLVLDEVFNNMSIEDLVKKIIFFFNAFN